MENYKKYMKYPVIFDGRNCYSLEDVESNGIDYYSIGRPAIVNNTKYSLQV